MKIRVVLVEDERPARERLRKALMEFDELEVVGEAENGPAAIKVIKEQKPDLVFLDVQIPVQNGIEVLRQLEERPDVIFTTAFDEYAIKAFELHAIDYLLKPYGRDRLRDAVHRSMSRIHDPADTGDSISRLVDDDQHSLGFLERLTVQDGYHYKVVEVSAIDCFVAEDGLVFAVMGNDRHLIDASLSHLEGQLDPQKFCRIHRKSIVNLDRVEQIVPWGQGKIAVALPNGEKLFVSRNRIQKFKRLVGMDL